MNTVGRFFINGIIMTLTSLFLRTLGVAFNAFVTNKLGADGVGLFTLIMSVYGFCVTVASSGVNLAATRLCAKAIGCGDARRLRSSLSKCLVYAAVCGSAACIMLLVGAKWIATDWLGDIRCKRSLCILAISLPFIALSNVLHGYFTAVKRVSKSAATQIFEQLFRMLVTVWALLYIAPDDIESACIALVGGGALAECASFLAALVLFLLDRSKEKLGDSICTPVQSKSLTRELLSITVPIAAAAYIRSALTTLEHILIPRGLKANPLTADTALASYGVLCGMAMPVVMFPTALLYSFTGLLVPEFAESDVRGDEARIAGIIKRAIGLTLIFSIGCAALLMQFSEGLGKLIYNSTDAGALIKVMAPLIPIMYLDHAVDAMLKGLGQQLYCMKVNILDAAMCALLVYILCPRIGIWGYIVTIYISEAINASLSLAKLSSISVFRVGILKNVIAPLLCGAGAALLTNSCGFSRCTTWGALILGVLTMMGTYILLLSLSGALDLGGLCASVKGLIACRNRSKRMHNKA